MHESAIEAQIQDSIATKTRLAERCVGQIEELCALALRALRGGGKLMFCGNGGSSCDAAHAAGELVGWFEDKERDGIAAIALGHEVPMLTAIGNDVGFEQVFARQLRAIGRPGDLLVGISTSGRSTNIVAAVEAAKGLGILTAALVSEHGGPIADLCDVAVRVPSTSTPRIQESHLLIVHVLCAFLEVELAAELGR